MAAMRNHRSARPRPLSATAASGAVILIGATIAACGGGEGSAATGSAGPNGGQDRAKLEQAALKHAECMRRQGIDVPDPKPGEGGVILSGPGGTEDPGGQRRAAQKCERYLRSVPPPRLSDEQKTEMRDGALKHARCMRSQGLDFPDPRFDGKGGISAELGAGFDPSDPRVRRAERKCRKLLPRPESDPPR